jgi:polyhydroxybutyrate depolymerase
MMSIKAWSGLVLALCCYGALGCGEDDASARSAATAGESSGGIGAGGKAGSKTDAGSSSGGKAGSSTTSGGSSGKAGSAAGGKASGGADAAGGQSGGGNGTGGAPEPTDGCQVQSKPATGKQSLDVGGTNRTYYLIASKVAEPVPLYIGFHGYGGNGEADQNTFNLQSRADGKGVFVFPDGVVQAWWQNALGWDNRSNDNADMDFVKQLIAEAKSKHCIDSSRIYVMGFSWGGWMATQVACALGDQLRAFASGGGGGPMNNTGCKPTSGLIMHGTNDGSEGIGSGRQSRDNFSKLNTCEAASTSVADNHCVSYAGCDLPVWWCEHGGGHEVPAGWGGDVVWEFFQSAPPH